MMTTYTLGAGQFVKVILKVMMLKATTCSATQRCNIGTML